MNQRFRSAQGFTLVEILVVVAIIALLASIVIVAVNPGQQFTDARNTTRMVDVRTIASAISQYRLKTGVFPPDLPDADYCGQSSAQEICATGAESCEGLIDLSPLTANALYLVAIPRDPLGNGNPNSTGYSAVRGDNGRVTACAPQAEDGVSISATQ